jgi:ABC-type phosphonate transport system ATPase subunit
MLYAAAASPVMLLCQADIAKLLMRRRMIAIKSAAIKPHLVEEVLDDARHAYRQMVVSRFCRSDHALLLS